jgi:hypothetical protein
MDNSFNFQQTNFDYNRLDLVNRDCFEKHNFPSSVYSFNVYNNINNDYYVCMLVNGSIPDSILFMVPNNDYNQFFQELRDNFKIFMNAYEVYKGKDYITSKKKEFNCGENYFNFLDHIIRNKISPLGFLNKIIDESLESDYGYLKKEVKFIDNLVKTKKNVSNIKECSPFIDELEFLVDDLYKGVNDLLNNSSKTINEKYTFILKDSLNMLNKWTYILKSVCEDKDLLEINKKMLSNDKCEYSHHNYELFLSYIFEEVVKDGKKLPYIDTFLGNERKKMINDSYNLFLNKHKKEDFSYMKYPKNQDF